MCDCDYPPILQAMALTTAYKSLLLPQHRAHLYKHSATPFEGSIILFFYTILIFYSCILSHYYIWRFCRIGIFMQQDIAYNQIIS